MHSTTNVHLPQRPEWRGGEDAGPIRTVVKRTTTSDGAYVTVKHDGVDVTLFINRPEDAAALVAAFTAAAHLIAHHDRTVTIG